MEKNYYPLRVGNTLGTIVSNIRTYINETDSSDSEVKHYGGYFICESVITQILAKQLVDAYNEKYRCETDHSKACIGGKTCCQQKCKCPDVGAHRSTENSAHSFTEGSDFESPLLLQEIMLDHQNVIEEGQNPNETHYDFLNRLHLSFSKIKDFINNQSRTLHNVDVEKVIEDLVIHCKKWGYTDDANRDAIIQNAEAALGMLQAFNIPVKDHSFTEGSELKSDTPKTINDQISFIEIMIEERKHLLKSGKSMLLAIRDNLLTLKHLNKDQTYGMRVDVIKVIEDLKELAEELNTEIAISEHPAIQNAEAALGMLQAFNIPVKDNGVNNSEFIKNKLASMLRNTDNVGEASAIIWAIGEMIKIKNGI